MLPSNCVLLSDHTTAVPALPLCVALTSSWVSDSVVVSALARSASLPCQPPPTRMRPPPLVPVALRLAPASVRLGAVMAISPPRWPLAEAAPEIQALVPASMRMEPPVPAAPSAFMLAAVVCSTTSLA